MINEDVYYVRISKVNRKVIVVSKEDGSIKCQGYEVDLTRLQGNL